MSADNAVRPWRARLRAATPRLLRTLVDNRRWYASRVSGKVGSTLFPAYRPLLSRVTFIGVTGSCGKSTTKELVAGVLASRFAGRRSHANLNQPWHLATSLLTLRPWHCFCVAEISLGRKGEAAIFEDSLRLVRPRIGIVTNVGMDHIAAFGSMDGIARQKGRLVEALPADGLALLNADDPRVVAMRSRSRAPVWTFGVHADADFRAEDVRCAWPDRLSFTVVHRDTRCDVRTALCGDHWVSAALAAIAVGVRMGLSLEDAAQALRGVEPFEGRMSPVARDDGVTFIRDDGKAPLWTFAPAFRFIAAARAARKWIVVGAISDYLGSSTKAYADTAREALTVADRVVFVGPASSKALSGAKGDDAPRLRAFQTMAAASEYLAGELAPGDLVLIKGTESSGLDRLLRVRATQGERKPAPTRVAPPEPSPPANPSCAEWAIVGLGNPEDALAGSPHNVGRLAVDRLAQRLGAQWTACGSTRVATVTAEGRRLHLVKPMVAMNDIGPALHEAAKTIGFVPQTCVLVHDELELPLGKVRTRMDGSDGGHRGVRSVLAAFESRAFRRAKIGIGRPAAGQELRDFVLGGFDDAQRARIEQACDETVTRVLKLIHDATVREGTAPRAETQADGAAVRERAMPAPGHPPFAAGD